MKLTKKSILFYDQVQQELEEIGSAIATSIHGSLYCKSFDVHSDGIYFNIWQYGCRGGSDEGWGTISATFDEILHPNNVTIITDKFKAERVRLAQLRADKEAAAKRERDLQTLAELKAKYDS